jgi:hypothetical protein
MPMKPRIELPEHLHRKRQREHKRANELERKREEDAKALEGLPPLGSALVRRRKVSEP